MAEDNLVLKAEKISKKYLNPIIGAAFSVLKEITFDLRRGEVLTLLGPSGSGKTTLLKILAGIEKPDEGSVQFAQYPEPKVNSAFIPREASSLPWLNVLEDVRLGLGAEEGKDKDSAEKIKNLIEEVGLDGYENHIPAGKSTGFRFRIALARAMASRPKVILIDSPLGNLLPERKIAYYRVVREVLSKGDFSIIWSTSDITEALLVSDRILLLNAKSGGLKEFQLENIGIPEIASLKSEALSGIRSSIEISLYSASPIQ